MSNEVELHGGDLPERFSNPGLPDHRHRMADIDEKAAKNAERQVATLFALSSVGTLVALVSYFAVKLDPGLGFVAYVNRVKLSTELLGIGLAVALFCLGAGAIHWAKPLMPDEERVE